MGCWLNTFQKFLPRQLKTLGFLHRNLAFAAKRTKGVAYKTLVQPKLEYAAPIWSPYTPNVTQNSPDYKCMTDQINDDFKHVTKSHVLNLPKLIRGLPYS